ncbi:unnamed protein product [Microthlaspi erraticum]|uniref:Uncharacterized protein n=1 Tax=Microthlaspi erraticum TaxID=1685480 RepID=A0A6D2JAN5_9BRAS|nr:unnamed protein product [Microthlaspi erraticum]
MGTSSTRMWMMAGSLWRTCNSNGSYGEEYDRTNRSSTHHSIESDEKLRKDVKALNEKLDKLILAQSTMKKVNFVSAEEMEPVQEGEDTQFAEVCYMSNGQGGYNKGYYNYKSNPAMSYRNTDVANPQDQVYPQHKLDRVKPTTWVWSKEQLPRTPRDFSWSTNEHTTWLSPPTTPACTYARE